MRIMCSSLHRPSEIFLCKFSRIDYWLPMGISGYLVGLFIKKIFGNNEYRYDIYKVIDSYGFVYSNNRKPIHFANHFAKMLPDFLGW